MTEHLVARRQSRISVRYSSDKLYREKRRLLREELIVVTFVELLVVG
jgi:hypothetical protein